MSFIASVIILFLSMLIQAFLQLSPGVFAIFYHSALSNYSRSHADDLSLSFILGQEIMVSITFLTVFLCAAFSYRAPSDFTETLPWILAGIFIAEAFAIAFFYFRRPRRKAKKSKTANTRLFITRKSAASLTLHAKKIKTRGDAIILGLITNLIELPFTLPLYIIMSMIIVEFTALSSNLLIIFYILVATMPLFAIRCLYVSDHHLAEIQRLRAHIKPFVRIVLAISYLLIAILIIVKEFIP